jgi:apolipoprotein N-acyltransferase
MSLIAKRLKSVVVGGYPEKFVNKKGKEEWYNSMYVIS